jgi:hypothetical protein
MERVPPEIFLEIVKIISEDPYVSTAELSNLQVVSKQFLKNIKSEQGQKILSERKTKVQIYDPFRTQSQKIELELSNQDIRMIKRATSKIFGFGSRRIKELNIILDPPSGNTSFSDYLLIAPSNTIVFSNKRIHLSEKDRDQSVKSLKEAHPEILNIFKNDFSNEVQVYVYYSDETRNRVTKIKIRSEN